MVKKMTHIGSILGNALNNFRPSSDTGMTKIWKLWDNALGNVTAREAKPGAFRDGILIVHVSNSVWLQHLTFLQEQIKADLNNALGDSLIKELKFKIAVLHN